MEIALIVIPPVGISLLQYYFIDQAGYYFLAFYGEVYFLPILLAGLAGRLLQVEDRLYGFS